MGGEIFVFLNKVQYKCRIPFNILRLILGCDFETERWLIFLKLSCFQCLKIYLGNMLSFLCVGVY